MMNWFFSIQFECIFKINSFNYICLFVRLLNFIFGLFIRRYCFVQLKPDADIEQVKKEISQIEFGTGKISVENKITRHEVSEVRNKKITIFWAFAHYVFSYCGSADKISKCVVVFGLT